MATNAEKNQKRKALDDIELKIIERLRELRSTQGLSMTQLANMVGVSQPFISDIEKYKKAPGHKTLHDTCRAFGITMAEFWTSIENPLPSCSDEEASTTYNRICHVARLLDKQELRIFQQLLDKWVENRSKPGSVAIEDELLKLVNQKSHQ